MGKEVCRRLRKMQRCLFSQEAAWAHLLHSTCLSNRAGAVAAAAFSRRGCCSAAAAGISMFPHGDSSSADRQGDALSCGSSCHVLDKFEVSWLPVC